MTDIVLKLLAAKDAYYNSDTDLMTDAEFDALERELREEDPTNSYFLGVGSEIRGDKVKLPIPLGSLDQVYLGGDALAWAMGLDLLHQDFVLTDKLDGLSGLLIYDVQGNLQIGYSRGDGHNGQDITRHFKRMKNLVQQIPSMMGLMTRTEVIMREDDFKRLNKSGALGRTFKNARNYVAGQMNRKEADQVFYDHAHVVAYDVLTVHLDKLEQLKHLELQGFETPGYVVVKGEQLTDDNLISLLARAKEASPYWLDGVVIDVDTRHNRNSIGARTSSSLNPVHARKFKINGDDNRAVVKVVEVHWNISKLGYLKPRVEIEPVDLVGVTITFATGFNAKFILDRKIGPGAEIQITRSGDVIPFIEKVITPAREASMPDEDYGETYWTPSGVDLVLVEDHEDAKFKRLVDFFGGIGVPDLRGGNVKKLYETGFDTMTKIILASEPELKTAIGNANGAKIFVGIKAKLNPVFLWKIAGATGLFGRGIGQRKMKKLFEKYGDFLELTIDQIIATDGFSRTTAELIVKAMPSFLEFLISIEGHYSLAEKVAPAGDSLKSVVAVFTGVRDKALEERIVSEGGTIGGSVNAKTTHLVAKDPSANSSKLVSARKLGVSVIGLEEALALWS